LEENKEKEVFNDEKNHKTIIQELEIHANNILELNRSIVQQEYTENTLFERYQDNHKGRGNT
jgi:hypothetical protein